VAVEVDIGSAESELICKGMVYLLSTEVYLCLYVAGMRSDDVIVVALPQDSRDLG
jgi:hypothetical protein